MGSCCEDVLNLNRDPPRITFEDRDPPIRCKQDDGRGMSSPQQTKNAEDISGASYGEELKLYGSPAHAKRHALVQETALVSIGILDEKLPSKPPFQQHVPKEATNGTHDQHGKVGGTPGRREHNSAARYRLNFVCAFGFTGKFDEPDPPPNSKDDFLATTKVEVSSIRVIQLGLQAYQQEINSRKYCIFSTDFLIHQNTAIVVTLSQLDDIVGYIQQLEREVDARGYEGHEVDQEVLLTFKEAQLWVARTRAILTHSHVFYKINFVLASGNAPA